MPLGPMELVFCTHRTPFYCWDFPSIYCIRLVCTLSISFSLFFSACHNATPYHLEFLNATSYIVVAISNATDTANNPEQLYHRYICNINIFETFSPTLMEYHQSTEHLKFISRINVNVYKKSFQFIR